MNKCRKSLFFSLSLLPFAIVGGIFVTLYQIDLYPAEMLEPAIEQLGSVGVLVAITALQTAFYALFCGFIGSLLSQQLGLWKRFTLSKQSVMVTLLLSVLMGVLFSLDYWTFGAAIPLIRESASVGMTVSGVIASVLYGGVIEEVMLRLFFLSLAAWVLWKVFFRKREKLTDGIFWAANILAAILFAAGHLPATAATFGELTPLLLIRCFLLNGGFAIGFGWLYKKYGIGYAMLSHVLVHIVSKLIWLIFI